MNGQRNAINEGEKVESKIMQTPNQVLDVLLKKLCQTYCADVQLMEDRKLKRLAQLVYSSKKEIKNETICSNRFAMIR